MSNFHFVKYRVLAATEVPPVQQFARPTLHIGVKCGFTPPLFFRHQFVIDELQEFGDAQLVHAGAMVVGFDAQGFVQAFWDANRDNSGGFFFQIDNLGAFFPEPGKHLLDFAICFALLKYIEYRPWYEMYDAQCH